MLLIHSDGGKMNSGFHRYLSSARSVLCSSSTAQINSLSFINNVFQNLDSINGWINRKNVLKGIHSREHYGNFYLALSCMSQRRKTEVQGGKRNLLKTQNWLWPGPGQTPRSPASVAPCFFLHPRLWPEFWLCSQLGQG